MQKIKSLLFGTKNARIADFGAPSWTYHFHIWNRHPRICLTAKFCQKKRRKMSKFGTKNALYFQPRIFKKLLSYLKSAPSNLSNWKVLQKNPKMSKFGTKNALFWYFWARIWKSYCHIWNQHSRISQKWVFNSYSEFWYKVRCF